MKEIKIFIDHPFEAEIRYSLCLMEDSLDCKFNFLKNEQGECLTINQSEGSSIKVSSEYFQKLLSGETQWQNYFTSESPVMFNGKPDYIFSIFYIANSFQEYNLKQHDQYDRLRTEDTWQCRFSLIKKNLVAGWIEKFAETYLSGLDVRVKTSKSQIFLSHDIDSVYGSLLQDSFWCLKKYRITDMLKIFIDTISAKPDWFNMDKIMQIENEYDFRSTFFWIVTKDRGRYNLINADYDIHSKKVVSTLPKISETGWTNGLHKSAASYSFEKELKMFPDEFIISNRYHYLLFNLPDGYKKIADAGLKFDSSLGFADMMGFRNSYALPFKPYDLSSRKTYGFVECPLHVMDTTYHFYNKLGAERLVEDTITFVENNNSNAVISVLFHNNYISDYKFGEYLIAFKKLLSYFYESGLKSISPQEITKTYLREY